MIRAFLYLNLNFIIICFLIYPFVFCPLVAGIEGLKDGFDLITDKNYYLKAVIPSFIIVNFIIIISVFIKLLMFKNCDLICISI